MVETSIGGDDGVLISPWRHIRESGPIALDMGVHFTDIFSYFLGDLSAPPAPPSSPSRSGAAPRTPRLRPGSTSSSPA